MRSTTVALALIVLTIQSAAAFDATDAIEVFAGFMNGIIHKDNLNYLLGCMNGTSSLVVDIQNMVTHFEQGGMMGIGEGIQDIGKFLQDLPPTCYNCDGIPDDFHKMGEFFKIFTNFTQLSSNVMYNMLWHYSEITKTFSTAFTEWDQDKYFEFGTDFGAGLVLAVGDDSMRLSGKPMFRVYEIGPNDPAYIPDEEWRNWTQLIKDNMGLLDRYDNDFKLSVYAYGKQGSKGDCDEEEPSFFSFTDHAKWSAWDELRGMEKQVARQKFIELAKQVLGYDQ